MLRIKKTRHKSLFSLLGEYRSVFGQILHSKPILAALSLLVIANIFGTVHGSFWGVLFTTKLGFAESQISLYVMLRFSSATVDRVRKLFRQPGAARLYAAADGIFVGDQCSA